MRSGPWGLAVAAETSMAATSSPRRRRGASGITSPLIERAWDMDDTRRLVREAEARARASEGIARE
jgi:hypothetical protein